MWSARFTQFDFDNLNAEFVTFYNTGEPEIAVDPRNQDLYFYQLMAGTWSCFRYVILGPVPHKQELPINGTSPIYAELPSFPSEHSSPRGFFVDSQGVLFMQLFGTIYRIPQKGQVEQFYPQNGRANWGELYYVKQGDRIPGTQAGDIVATAYKSSEEGRFAFDVIALSTVDDNPQPRIIASAILPSAPVSLSTDADGYLYLLTDGYHNSSSPAFEIYRLEMNGNLTSVYRTFDDHREMQKIAFWPKDSAFYLASHTERLRISPIDSALLQIQQKSWLITELLTSLDGEHLYMMDRALDRPYQDLYLEKLSLNGPYPTPTGIYIPKAFPTPLPADFPTATPTPTNTPTMTPTPVVPEVALPNFEIRPVFRLQPYLFAVQPKTGNIYVASVVPDPGQYFSNLIEIYKVDKPVHTSGMEEPIQTKVAAFPLSYRGHASHMSVGSDGTIAIMMRGHHTEYAVHILWPDGREHTAWVGIQPRPAYAVPDSTKILDAKEGDVFIGNLLFRKPVNAEDPVEMEETALPGWPDDMTEGPDGRLFLLMDNKIYYIDENGETIEWTHWFLPGDPSQLIYNPLDASFYVLFGRYGKGSIVRLSDMDQRLSHLSDIFITGKPSIGTITGKNGFYLIYRQSEYGESIIAEVRNADHPLTPTSTPAAPSPTPTPIKGWFVLDGLGGIHSTNPEIPRPVLPYWPDFNIVRDIEPDPQGRGWYMLDGFGGIHTSSPELPKPDTLPYFGFDIARNLEVKEKNGILEFYILDGYGVIHSTDAEYPQGMSSIWFGADVARDLNPAVDSDEWIVMDELGYLYQGIPPKLDAIRSIPPSWNSPIMRGFVRFPDETTVMLDYYGGRHTNKYFPAQDVLNGLPGDFYFPSWDILWDLEVVPQNWGNH